MDTTLTLKGRVGTDLVTMKTSSNVRGVRFRMAVSQWRRNDDGSYQDLGSRWYTIRAWGKLAQYVLASVHKGDPVVVCGRPSAHAWVNATGETMADLVITAQVVGHDLNYGTARFYKNGGDAPALVHHDQNGDAAQAQPSVKDSDFMTHQDTSAPHEEPPSVFGAQYEDATGEEADNDQPDPLDEESLVVF